MAGEKADLLTRPGLGCYLWDLLELRAMQVMGDGECEGKREGPWGGKQELSWNPEVRHGLCVLGPATALTADLASLV